MKHAKLILFFAVILSISGYFMYNLVWMSGLGTDYQPEYTSGRDIRKSTIFDGQDKSGKRVAAGAAAEIGKAGNSRTGKVGAESEKKFIDIELSESTVLKRRRTVPGREGGPEDYSSTGLSRSETLHLDERTGRQVRDDPSTSGMQRPPQEPAPMNVWNHPTSTGVQLPER